MKYDIADLSLAEVGKKRILWADNDVPMEIEEQVSRLKLKSMSIAIDKLTPEQVEYLSSSGEGT